MKSRGGFTIVELLVVVVVIGVLASIVVVSFNGIRARANNVATVSAVRQLVTLIEMYHIRYNAYPYTNEIIYPLCGTSDGKCTSASAAVNSRDNSPLMNELRKVGTPPQSTGGPVATGQYGIQYIYLSDPAATFNGLPAPVRIEYFLDGTATNCGLQNISAWTGNNSPTVTSTTGYTSSSNGTTSCSLRL